MRVSRVTTKEKHRYALDNLGGVDFSSSPLLCAPNRSPDAANWIGDHGINRKRHGWEQVCDVFFNTAEKVSEGINGIFPIKPSEDRESRVLVHAMTYLYLLTKGSGGWSKKAIHGAMTDSRSACFFQGDIAYIVGAGAIVPFDMTSEKVVSFIDNAYIPTTTINIGVDGKDGDKRFVIDSPNLLTPWRKNTLEGLASTSNARWTLDGKIKSGTTVTVEVDALITKDDGQYEVTHSVYTNNNANNLSHLYDKDEKGVGHIDFDNGKISLSIVTPPPVEGQANITVTFNADIEDLKSYINGCTFGTLYGYGGAHDRLFLSGNPAHPNVIFFSEENNFNYFPDTYTITLGGEDDPVKGFVYLSDNTLAALCEKSVYYIGGEARTEYDESGNIKRITPVFTRQAGAISEGALNAFCAANFGGDNVFLSKHGLFGIEPTSNVLTNTRTARERSYAINARLNLLDPSKASIYTHGQRLYISDGTNCFVADSAYKYVPTGSEGYNYEWWYWTHVPARVWAEVDGELWFGTTDGRVCRFTDGYKDVTWDYTADGEITYNNNEAVTYREDDKLAEIVNERRVRFTNAGTGTWSDAIGDLTEVDLYAHITESGLRFARYADATDAELITFAQNGQNPILRVYDDRPVVADWVSPPLDLGNDSIAKTLFSLSVTAEAGQKSKLTFGYETRKGSGEWNAQGLGKFSFEDFDFTDFSFETGFQNTHTVRAHDRNFNFIRFHLRSDGDRPCAVHRIAAIYKNNKYSKGVV